MKKILLIASFLLLSYLLNAQSSYPFENSSYTRLNNVNIHYRVWFPCDRPVAGKILLLHGFAGSTYSWRNNIKDLTDRGFMVVAMDLPPFGYSEKIKTGLTLNALATIVNSFMHYIDANDLKARESKWVISGHSMGAGVATAVAQKFPEKISSLILINGVLNYHLSPVTRLLLSSYPVKTISKIIVKKMFLTEKYCNKTLSKAYGTNVTSEEVKNYLSPLKSKGTLNAIADMFLSKDNFHYDIKKVNVPVLVLWGNKDQWFCLGYANFIYKQFENAGFEEIPGAGHCPMESHPNITNNLIVNFIYNEGLSFMAEGR